MRIKYIIGQLIDSPESVLIIKNRKGGVLITDGPCYSGTIFIVLLMIGSVLLLCSHTTHAAKLEVLQDKTSVRIRLANIDAPEKRQPFGRWSTNQLKGLVAAQPVTVTYTQTDRYGRIIGRVFTENGTEASLFMVQTGAAWVYERFNTDYGLPDIQIQARKGRRGLWLDTNPVEPWIWRKNQKMKYKD